MPDVDEDELLDEDEILDDNEDEMDDEDGVGDGSVPRDVYAELTQILHRPPPRLSNADLAFEDISGEDLDQSIADYENDSDKSLDDAIDLIKKIDRHSIPLMCRRASRMMNTLTEDHVDDTAIRQALFSRWRTRSPQIIKQAMKHYPLVIYENLTASIGLSAGFLIEPAYFISDSGTIARCGPWVVEFTGGDNILRVKRLSHKFTSRHLIDCRSFKLIYQPHIQRSGGAVCFGSELSRATAYSNERDLIGLLTLFEEIRRHYNPGDAFHLQRLFEQAPETVQTPPGLFAPDKSLVYESGRGFYLTPALVVDGDRKPRHVLGCLKLHLTDREAELVEAHPHQFAGLFAPQVSIETLSSFNFLLPPGPNLIERAREAGFPILPGFSERQGSCVAQYTPTFKESE